MNAEHRYFFFDLPWEEKLAQKMEELFKEIEDCQKEGWRLITLQLQEPHEGNCFIRNAFVVMEREKGDQSH